MTTTLPPGTTHSPSPVAWRRILFTALALLPIAGCTASPVLSPAFSQVGEQLAVTLGGMKSAPVSAEYVAKLPYASMFAKIGRGPQSLVILYDQQKTLLSWIAADRTVLVTQHGRIIQTGGLEKGLAGTLFADADPLPGIGGRTGAPINRLIDLPYRQQFSIPVQGELRFSGEETITTLDKTYQTRVYTETCRAPLIDWEFTNTFWVDKSTGLVVKSRQFVSPDVPAIETAIAKPPAL